MPAWPPSLPQEATIRNMQIGGPANAFKRSQMDAGPPKTRRISSASSQFVQLVFAHLTDAQIGTFESWFLNDIGAGSLSFTLPHPITGATRDWLFANTEMPYQYGPSTRKLNQLTCMLELLP